MGYHSYNSDTDDMLSIVARAITQMTFNDLRELAEELQAMGMQDTTVANPSALNLAETFSIWALDRFTADEPPGPNLQAVPK